MTGIIEALEKEYGAPGPPPSTDPWERVLRVNVVYLADDEDRERAFKVTLPAPDFPLPPTADCRKLEAGSWKLEAVILR